METSAAARVPTDDRTERRPAGPLAYSWGYNARAGLGLGHTAPVTTPVALQLPEGTVDVQGGLNFTVALTLKGAVYAWGGNQYGQLGDGTTQLRWKPTRVQLPRGTKVSGIAVGTDHVVARTSSGEVLAWGHNHRGQVGNGSTTDQHLPVRVARITARATTVAAGNGISAVLTRSGDVLLWGRDSFGQLGLKERRDGAAAGTLAQTRPVRAHLPRGADPVAVDAGHRHVAVALRDGRLVLFGLDAAGRPQEGSIALKSSWGRPVSVCAGDDFTLVLTNRHVLLAIGGNASGQLGVGDRRNRLTPAVVTLPRARGRILEVTAGARSAAAVTSAGEVFTWGDGNVGQHGAGPAEDALLPRATPQRVKPLAGARATNVSGGDHHVVVTVDPARQVGGRPVSARTPSAHPAKGRSGRLVATAGLSATKDHS